MLTHLLEEDEGKEGYYLVEFTARVTYRVWARDGEDACEQANHELEMDLTLAGEFEFDSWNYDGTDD